MNVAVVLYQNLWRKSRAPSQYVYHLLVPDIREIKLRLLILAFHAVISEITRWKIQSRSIDFSSTVAFSYARNK